MAYRAAATFLLLALCCGAALAQPAYDYGDAASPYPTCSHQQITSGQPLDLTHLGSHISYDSVNPVSGGWNADTGDDGVVISNFRKGATATIDVYTWFVFGNTVYAVWCDFNNDGNWDATERVLIRGAGAGGYGLQVGKNTDTFAVPATATGTYCKIRARCWDASYTGGTTFGLGYPGAATGACQGGECEDYDLAYDGNPEVDLVPTSTNVSVASGSSEFRGRMTLGMASTFTYQVYNRGTSANLTISAIGITGLTGGTAVIAGGFSTPVSVIPSARYVFNLTVTPTASRVSFTLSITTNDTTGNESPFTLNITGGVGLSGNYTINNAGGADFADIGAAFDELELVGINGAVTFTVYAGSGPYVSNASYGLGLDNEAGATETATVALTGGIGPGANAITFRAAAGQRPQITGCGAKFYYFWVPYVASVVIATPNVAFEGFEVMNGTQFGIVLLAKSQPVINCQNSSVRNCMIHDISLGPAILTLGVNWGTSQSDNQVIENNLIWGCVVGRAPIIYGFSTGSANIINGAISYWWASSTGTVCRHNTVLVTAGLSATGSAGCISFSRCYIAEHIGNVYVQLTSGQPVLYVQDAGNEPGTSNYNGYYSGTGATFISGTSSVTGLYANFAQWQYYGRDPQGFNTNPLLVNSGATPDLHIQSGSPAIDRATGSTLNVDFDGDTRPQGAARDSGADEYVPGIPQIQVSRSGVITSGGTDNLGAGYTGGAASNLTYTVSNVGTGLLSLTGSPLVAVSGATGCVVNMTQAPATSISQASSTAFVLQVTPSGAGGAFSFSVNIANNDSANNPYMFTASGTANPAPAAAVTVHEGSVGGPAIASGAPASGARAFGNQDIATGPGATLTIVIENSGTATLTLATPVLGGTNASSFVINTSATAASVAPGASTSFTLAFDPTTVGAKSANVTFTHNASGSPFTINISGTGISNNPVVISTPDPLPSGRLMLAYNQALASTGGVGPFVWTLVGGTLPTGVNFSSTGVLSGTPTGGSGTFNFTVQVADSVGTTDTKPYSLFIDIQLGVGGSMGKGTGGGGGCTTGTDQGALWLALLALTLAMARTLRRRAA